MQFSQEPVRAKKTKEIKYYGYGWPRGKGRWGTRLKQSALDSYAQALSWQGYELPIVQCIGIAADEEHRIEAEGYSKRLRSYMNFRFPLVEYGITEAQALDDCKRLGFDWGGLYSVFHRLSCFCCPQGGIAQAQKIRTYLPDAWEKMLEMAAQLPGDHPGRFFASGNRKKGIKSHTLHDLETRFAAEAAFESRKIPLPGMTVHKPALECGSYA